MRLHHRQQRSRPRVADATVVEAGLSQCHTEKHQRWIPKEEDDDLREKMSRREKGQGRRRGKSERRDMVEREEGEE